MDNSITTRTADLWSDDLAAALSTTEDGWTAQPGTPNEPRNVAYLIGPADDERIRLTLAHDSNGNPTGKITLTADLAGLEEYSPPGTHRQLRAVHPVTEPEQITTSLVAEIIPALREVLPACRAKRNRIAAAEDTRAAIMREITARLPMNPEPKPRATTAYIGGQGSEIVGRISPYCNDEVAFDLIVSYREALALAEYLAERRQQLGDDGKPDDNYHGYRDDEAPF